MPALLVGVSMLTISACSKSKQTSLKHVHFQQETVKKPIKKGGTLTVALENNSPFTGIFLEELQDTEPDEEASAPGEEGLFYADTNSKITDKGPAVLRLNRKNKTATIQLKKNVRWSDGKPVTAQDMYYSYEILGSPKVSTTQYTSSLENIVGLHSYHVGKNKKISGISMPDGKNGRTLILHFKQMNPAMLQHDNGFFWEYAAPYHYLKDIPMDKLISSDKVRKYPLFFGPYKMDKTVRGQSTTWSRNPYYWRGQPNFKHIEMTTVSVSSASQAIKSRKFDIAAVLSEQFEEVKNTKGVNFIGRKTPFYDYLGFRVGKWDNKLGKNIQTPHSKMDNVSLRKAMLYAMNVDAVNKRFYHGLRYRLTTLIPSQFGVYHDKTIPGYPYDLKKANQLLNKAGYKKRPGASYRSQPNGKKLVINLAVRDTQQNVEAIWTNYIQQWKKIGLDVRFVGGRPMEFNNWVEAVKASSPKIDVFEGSWDPSGDPSPNVFYGEKMPYNFSRFTSPTNTQLLSDIDSTKSFNKNYRIKKLHQWQQWMYQHAYVAPLSGSYSITAVNSNISNWSKNPSAHNWYEAGFYK